MIRSSAWYGQARFQTSIANADEARRPFDSLAIEFIGTGLSCMVSCEPCVVFPPLCTSRRDPAGPCRVTRSYSALAHSHTYICATYLHVHAVRPKSCWPCCGAPRRCSESALVSFHALNNSPRLLMVREAEAYIRVPSSLVRLRPSDRPLFMQEATWIGGSSLAQMLCDQELAESSWLMGV